MYKQACLYVFEQENHIKARIFSINFTVHFYPPLHHNGKVSSFPSHLCTVYYVRPEDIINLRVHKIDSACGMQKKCNYVM